MPVSLAERDPERVQEKEGGGTRGWAVSAFLFLITEAKIKISKGMDVWRIGNKNLGINREWVFAPAMQRALNCPAHETMLTFVFLSSFHKVYFEVLGAEFKPLTIIYSSAFFALFTFPYPCSAAIFHWGNDEYLTADRSTPHNPFFLGARCAPWFTCVRVHLTF